LGQKQPKRTPKHPQNGPPWAPPPTARAFKYPQNRAPKQAQKHPILDPPPAAAVHQQHWIQPSATIIQPHPPAPGRAAGGNPGRVPSPTEGGWPRCPRQGCTQCRGPQAPHRRCTPAGSKRSRCAAPRSPWPPGLRLLLGDIDQIYNCSRYPSLQHIQYTHYPAVISHYLCPNQLLSSHPQLLSTIYTIRSSHPQSLSTISRCCPPLDMDPISAPSAANSHYPAIMYPVHLHMP
jgi:hypothetical protein